MPLRKFGYTHADIHIHTYMTQLLVGQISTLLCFSVFRCFVLFFLCRKTYNWAHDMLILLTYRVAHNDNVALFVQKNVLFLLNPLLHVSPRSCQKVSTLRKDLGYQSRTLYESTTEKLI